MKALRRLLGVGAVAVIVAYVVGAGMAPSHTLTRTRSFAAPSEKVWSALLSIRQLPYDRSDLRIIDQGTSTRPPGAIEVVGTPVEITIETIHPPRDLVVKTKDPSLAYGGTWTLTVVPEGNDLTRLTVVEEATVRSRFVRFFVRTFGFDDVFIDGIFRAVTRKITEMPRGE